LTVELSKSASPQDINAAFKAAVEGKLKEILTYYDATDRLQRHRRPPRFIALVGKSLSR
jgi:glyceraldehyde-3-phosphate dehydrogenase/erythrose-4-phosphate dehydrogenase